MATSLKRDRKDRGSAGGWGPPGAHVRERGEHAVRRQDGDHRGQHVTLLVLGERRPRKAADHDIGLAEPTLRQHRGEVGRVRVHDVDRRMECGRLLREPWIDPDGDVLAASRQAPLNGVGEGAGAGAEFHHDRRAGPGHRRHPGRRRAARRHRADRRRGAHELEEERRGSH